MSPSQVGRVFSVLSVLKQFCNSHVLTPVSSDIGLLFIRDSWIIPKEDVAWQFSDLALSIYVVRAQKYFGHLSPNILIFVKNKISLAENKHICCLNTKEGTSFWTLLTTKDFHLASGNEATLTWCYYTLITLCYYPKNELFLMKGLQPCSVGLPWTFTSVTCDRQEGWSSVMALLQWLCGTWQFQFIEFMMWNSNPDREHPPSSPLKINSHEFLINNKRLCHQHSEPQPGLSWLRGQKSA